jgi:uncharacterized membrane protein
LERLSRLRKEIYMRDGRSLFELVLELIDRHRGAAAGAAVGLVVALLMIIFGFWKTVGIAICILIGYFVGRHFDEEGGLEALWRRLFGER